MSCKNPELVRDPRPIAGIGRFPGVDTERELYSTAGSARNRLSQEEKEFLYQLLSGQELCTAALPFLPDVIERVRNRNGYRMFYWAKFEERRLAVCPTSSGESVVVGSFKWVEGDGGGGYWRFKCAGSVFR